jgi:hypothetical protein
MLNKELGNRSAIVGNDTPANPALHACFAISQAAIQLPGASQLADASFDPIAEALCSPKPGLVFVIAALVGFIAGLRQADALHAQEVCPFFVGGRVNTAIATDFFGWLAEEQAVMAQAGQQQCFSGIALQETIFAHQSSIDFGIPDFATEPGLFGFGFAAPDQSGMGLKQAQHFLAGGGRFPLQDAGLGLGDDLLNQRQIVLQALCQPIRSRLVQLAQAGLDLSYLFQQGLHHCQQLLIQFHTGFCRMLGLRTAQAVDLSGQVMRLAVSIAKPAFVSRRAGLQQFPRPASSSSPLSVG